MGEVFQNENKPLKNHTLGEYSSNVGNPNAGHGNLRKQWNDACLSVGIDSISPLKAAKIMAVLMHLGNNEAMVMNKHFLADVEYITARYNLKGGEVPDSAFVVYFREIEKQLNQSLEHKVIPQWAISLFEEDYQIKLWV